MICVKSSTVTKCIALGINNDVLSQFEAKTNMPELVIDEDKSLIENSKKYKKIRWKSLKPQNQNGQENSTHQYQFKKLSKINNQMSQTGLSNNISSSKSIFNLISNSDAQNLIETKKFFQGLENLI